MGGCYSENSDDFRVSVIAGYAGMFSMAMEPLTMPQKKHGPVP
jgi:hypothetical protein